MVATAGTLQNYNLPSLPQLPGGDPIFWRGELQKISKSINLLNAASTGQFTTVVSVKGEGAKGDGVTDDTAAIQTAINKVGALGGGTVFFPPGIYRITATLVIGNGSATAWSTVRGIYLQGSGLPVGAFAQAGGASPTIIRWAGPSGGFHPMLQISGPLAGWGVLDLALDCAASLGTYGLAVVSGLYGTVENVFINQCWTGIHTSCYDQGSLGGTPNTMHNSYRNISIILHDQANMAGIFLSGSGNASPNTNTSYERFDNITIGADGITNNPIGVYFQVCDSVQFSDLHIAFGAPSGGAAIFFDYSVNAAFPSSCKLFGVDPNGSHNSLAVNGSATIGDNVIELITTNGAAPVAASGISWLVASPDGISLKGRSDGSNPPTGYIGEYISATQSVAQSLTIGTALSLTNVVLGAGDWDVSGLVHFGNFNNISSSTAGFNLQASISATNNTVDGTDARLHGFLYPAITASPTGNPHLPIGPSRFSSNGSQTIYVVALAAGGGTITFGSGTNITSTGFIRARRVS